MKRGTNQWKKNENTMSLLKMCLTDVCVKDGAQQVASLIPPVSVVVFPLSLVLLSAVSFTCSQPQCKNIKWKIPEINNPQVLKYKLF